MEYRCVIAIYMHELQLKLFFLLSTKQTFFYLWYRKKNKPTSMEVHGLQMQNPYIALGVAKLVSRLFATEALWVRLQTSLENTKWATLAKEWRTHFSPQKIYKKAFVLLNS